MAGDWIKLEVATLDKPEVRQMARVLGVKHGEALELLLRFWAWMDANSVDGHVDGLVDVDVDELMRCPGFCGVMKMIGWLKCDSERQRIEIPNADRHNGKSAKKRALTNLRQSQWRKNVDASVDGAVDAASVTKASTREEKRRDRPIHTLRSAGKPSSLPADFSISERVRAWASEKGYRRLEARLEHFVGYAKRSGKRYADWDEAFMSAVREDWAKLGAQEPVRQDGVFRVAL